MSKRNANASWIAVDDNHWKGPDDLALKLRPDGSFRVELRGRTTGLITPGTSLSDAQKAALLIHISRQMEMYARGRFHDVFGIDVENERLQKGLAEDIKRAVIAAAVDLEVL